jgi:hypothetical protein
MWDRAQTRPVTREQACAAYSILSAFFSSHFLPSFPRYSLNYQKNLIELSLLPSDTGKPDVFSTSLDLPLLKQEERRGEAKERDQKEEKEKKKSQKRKKKKKSLKGQVEVKLHSQEKKEPQRPQGKQGKRERQESESEQVSHSGRIKPHLASPH